MIKLLVSDLDGTFLMPKVIDGKAVSPENIEAMNKFRAKGGTFVTASGRHHEYSYSLMKELGFDFDMIGTNGTTIIHNNCLLEHNHPPRHIAREVIEELTKDEYKEHLEVFGVDLSFIYIMGHRDSWYLSELERLAKEGTIGGISDVNLKDWIDDRKKPDLTCLQVKIRDPKRLFEWIEFLREKFSKNFDVYASGDSYIEMMRPGVNKGSGVRSMMKLYNLKEHEIAVVGDNQNDVSMFFSTPNSFVMSTAHDNVKKYAKYTVDSVAEAIDIILRKNEEELARQELIAK